MKNETAEKIKKYLANKAREHRVNRSDRLFTKTTGLTLPIGAQELLTAQIFEATQLQLRGL